MASVYVLRYLVFHEGGGLVDHKAYLDRGEAEAAMEFHRNEKLRFPCSDQWSQSEIIEVDPAEPLVRWTYDSYACWIEKLSLVACNSTAAVL